MSNEAKQKLLAYPFPGNIRELKVVIELAIVLSDGKEITDSDISFNSTRSLSQLFSPGKTLKQLNQMIVQHYLDQYDHNVLKVAEILDIGKSTIYRMLKEKAE